MTKQNTPKKKAALNIQMDTEEYEQIKAIAELNKRSLASYVRDVLIADDIEKHKIKSKY